MHRAADRRNRRGARRCLLIAALTGTAAMVAADALPAAADQPAAAGHGLQMRSSKIGAHRVSNLVDHGGQVQYASDVYVVWWGTQSLWSGDVQGGIASLFQGLNGSHYANTATQYIRGNAVSVTLAGTAVDTSAPPSNPSAATLAAEAARQFPTADGHGLYFVFTSNFPSGKNYCAWHSYGTVDGVVDGVAYMPNTTNISGCDPGNLYNLSGSEGLRSLANVTAHEFMESITDTVLNAWYDSSGSEIGDKCAWQFGSSVTLSNNTVWQLQEEWSNAVTGCVQQS